jgi:hypothetical protein
MTRKILITVILGAGALVLGGQSALAKPSNVTAMIQAREAALGRDFQLGDFAVNNTWRQALSVSTDSENTAGPPKPECFVCE